MRKKIFSPVLLSMAILFFTHSENIQAQSSITIDASQQITNFVFVDGAGIQDNTYMVFGEGNTYKPVYTGAYSFGYSYMLDFGLFFRANIGMRNAGATMVYDAVNYSWDFQYFQMKLGTGYSLNLGLFNPYIGLSGYYGGMLKANQRINNEDFDIIDSESINKHDIGLSIPLGVRLDASEFVSVYTEISYLMGLKNIETAGNGQEASNVAYQITLGLSFTIK